MYENKKIFVLGMARSGYSVAKLLANKNDILVVDQAAQDKDKIKELESLGVKFIQTDKPNDYFDNTFDVLIKNPGIMPYHETVLKANKLAKPVLNEMEVAYHYLPKEVFIIGITGSNGKTTTTTIVYEILKMMKINVVLGGNIGYPLSEIVPVVNENSVLLLEISDHQLANFKDFKTNISVITNIYPTHLDFHGTYENYIKIKSKIFNHHTKDDLAILNYTNEDSRKTYKNILSKKLFFNSKQSYVAKDGTIIINGREIININDIKIKGLHNYENIMAALLVINYFGINKKIIYDVLNNFNGVEHRIEFVKEENGVKYYNDSKATNPTSTIVALKSFKDPIHLILGGMERKQDFHELDNYIKNVKVIYAIGEASTRIADYANQMKIECKECKTLQKAMEEVKKSVKEKEIVLLSPASASWDQYDKFEDRGNEFKLLC